MNDAGRFTSGRDSFRSGDALGVPSVNTAHFFQLANELLITILLIPVLTRTHRRWQAPVLPSTSSLFLLGFDFSGTESNQNPPAKACE